AAKAAVITLQLLQARNGRSHQPVRLAFDATEVTTLAALNHNLEAQSKRLKNPHPPDSLAWAAWIIGRLGGWDGYPSSKPPCPITMKHGLEYFHAVATGWSLRDVCMPLCGRRDPYAAAVILNRCGGRFALTTISCGYGVPARASLGRDDG